MRNISEKVVENSKHTFYCQRLFPSNSYCLLDTVMWKYYSQSGHGWQYNTPQKRCDSHAG